MPRLRALILLRRRAETALYTAVVADEELENVISGRL